MNALDIVDTATAGRQLRRLTPAAVTPIDYAARGDSAELRQIEHAKAVRDGYADGYADGLARAEADTQRATAELAGRISGTMAALERAIRQAQEVDQRRRADTAQHIAATTFELVEALLGREVSLMENPGREAIVRALALETGHESVIVRLNPVDVDVLSQLGGLPVGRDYEIVVDESVEPAGAVVELGRSTLDAQLSSALSRVRRVLLGEDLF